MVLDGDQSALPDRPSIDRPRAGFWRRFAANLFDTIVLGFPFQIAAAILFAATSGMVQMPSGFYRACATVTPIPRDLVPSPPENSNFAQSCRVSFFGATTATTLTVARVTREGMTTRTISRGYMTDASGRPISGTSLDGIVSIAFAIYVVGMITKFGRTLGDRILRIKVIDLKAPDVVGIKFWKVILRYLIFLLGFVPMIIVLLIEAAKASESAFSGSTLLWLSFAGLFAMLWMLVIVFQIAMKRDPIYDRLAGTAVVRV
jgi:hypothetical protein